MVAAGGRSSCCARATRDVGVGRLRPVVDLSFVRLPEMDESIRARVGQWPKQNGVDDAEDRGVGADPEREREKNRQRKCGASAKTPEREPDVLAERTEPLTPRTLSRRSAVDRRKLRPRGREVAELARRVRFGVAS